MFAFAQQIKDNLDTLAGEYANRLQDIPAYAHLSHATRLEIAIQDYELIIDCLEAESEQPFVQFTEERAAERLEQDFAPDALLQALTALEATLLPLVIDVEEATLLWRTMSGARNVVSHQATQRLHVSMEQVAKSEERFRRLAENIPDGLTIIEDGQVVYMNDRLPEIFGYSLEELRDASSFDFAAPEEQENLHAFIEDVRSGTRPMDELSFWIIRKDGQRRFIHNRYALIREEEEIAGRFIVTSDETGRKRLQQTLRESLERRERQVQTSTEIAQEIAAAPALNELFQRVVTLIRERFGYYHAQIFRYEPALDAVVLVAGYGEAGEEMRADGHQLEMGHGVAGEAASTGRPVLVSDVTGTSNWASNPFLPETKSELAVPIKLGDEVLGILDVQSDVAGALTADDQILLEGLCGQIAIAIEGTRLRRETEGSLQELERLYRAMSREGWDRFQQSVEAAGYMFDQLDVVEAEELWIPEMKQAVESRDVVGASNGEHSAIVVPLSVYGEVIGVLGVQDDPQHPLTSEEQKLIQSVSDQVALALEGARLFEQTQEALSETELLYSASQALIAAIEPHEMLQAIAQPALNMGANTAVLYYIDLDEQGAPEWVEVIASIEPEGSQMAPVGARSYLAEFPLRHLLFSLKEGPLLIADVTRAPEIRDQHTVDLFRQMGVRAFAAIPLVRGRRWLGFVTLSWPTTHAFSPQERRLYSAIGPQLAAFIENRRLFEQTQAALEEIAATHRLYVRQEWADFVPAWASPFYERSRPDLPPLEGDTSSPRVQKAIAQAMKERRLISMPGGNEEQAESDVLVVPITLRGEVIGTLGLQETRGRWSDEDISLIQNIADQMALAIETARLFEETQRRAARERVVADITARVRSSLDLDGILQTAVRELAAALNTDRAFVQLTGLPQVSSTSNLPFEDISPEEVEE